MAHDRGDRSRGAERVWRAPLIRMARRTVSLAITLLSGYLAFALLPLTSIRHEPVPFKVAAILLLIIACGTRWFLSTLNVGLNNENRPRPSEQPCNSSGAY